jgi:hypothetical protein
MRRSDRISNNRALFVLCALGFLGASSGLAMAQGTYYAGSVNGGVWKNSSEPGKTRNTLGARTNKQGTASKTAEDNFPLPRDRNLQRQKAGADTTTPGRFVHQPGFQGGVR